MNSEQMVEQCKQYTLYSWSATDAVNPYPIARAEGVYFWTPEGKRFLDWNSQLMCMNIGHSHPKVIAAMKAALDGVIYAMPPSATEVRARFGRKLAGLLPGDLNTFFFTVGGSEANENAVRAARLYTGKFKILSRYRSYHGASNLCMQLTGDPRRWANEPGSPGIVHVMDPNPYHFSFGDDEASITEANLTYLDEVIMYEGPQTIAAMIIEPVTGTNGILAPPAGYLKGLRSLLTKHGILMIADEVMSGWGRTGRMFAFEHGDIVPDIVTMAKGLTSGYIPLGCVALSDPIAEHFRTEVFWGGLTYNAHPLALATAEAVIDVLIDEGMLENVQALAPLMRSEMDRLTAKHPCVKVGRSIGLFGMMDLQRNAEGEPMAPYNGTSPEMGLLGKYFHDEGLFTFLRWGSFMCNPPLCITKDQLLEGFDIVDRGLTVVDEAL